MRNIKFIREFMKANDIEVDETFVATLKVRDVYSKAKFKFIFIDDETLSLECIDCKGAWFDLNSEERLNYILFHDDITISKLYFKPKRGEYYYRVRRDGDVERDIYLESCIMDNAFFLIGNCFRTEEEALAHKEDVMLLLKRKEPFVNWSEDNEKC